MRLAGSGYHDFGQAMRKEHHAGRFSQREIVSAQATGLGALGTSALRTPPLAANRCDDRRLSPLADAHRLARSAPRLMLTLDRVLVDAIDHGGSTGQRCDADGDLETRAKCTNAALVEYGQSGQPRSGPVTAGQACSALQHEPVGRSLGQHSDGRVFLDAEDRADQPQCVPDPRPDQSRCVRLLFI